jgi:hypothetical protein
MTIVELVALDQRHPWPWLAHAQPVRTLASAGEEAIGDQDARADITFQHGHVKEAIGWQDERMVVAVIGEEDVDGLGGRANYALALGVNQAHRNAARTPRTFVRG